MSNSKPFIPYSQTHFHEVSALIDVDKPVEIYKNLNKSPNCWSVRQGGIVKLHTDYICLKSVKFVVQPAGVAKVRREKKKTVHAFVRGYLCSTYDMNKSVREFSMDCVSYNPYKWNSFINKDNEDRPVYEADFCDMMVEDSSPVIAAGCR